MTVVLLDSRKIGSSAWVYVKRARGIEVDGMEIGDLLHLIFEFQDRIGEELFIEENGSFPLPPGTVRLRAEHTRVSEIARKNGGVSVDLI